MDKFSKNVFKPSGVCSRCSARHGDHFEVCLLGYPLTPPWAADQLTHHPPPPSRPPKVFASGWGLEFEQAAPLGSGTQVCLLA